MCASRIAETAKAFKVDENEIRVLEAAYPITPRSLESPKVCCSPNEIFYSANRFNLDFRSIRTQRSVRLLPHG